MALPRYLINHCQRQSDVDVPTALCQDLPGVANYRVFIWPSLSLEVSQKALKNLPRPESSLAGYQCLHALDALVSSWQAQVPAGS